MSKANDSMLNCSHEKCGTNQMLQKWILFRLGIVEVRKSRDWNERRD